MAGSIFLTSADGSQLTSASGAYLIWGSGDAQVAVPVRPRRRKPAPRVEVGQTSYVSAAELVRRVIDFAQRQPEWAECVVYETRRDERWDLTLVSQRVYGNRSEFLVVMAAAGLDSVEQELTERTIVLPTARQLAAMKTRAGFSNDPWARTTEQVVDPVNTR